MYVLVTDDAAYYRPPIDIKRRETPITPVEEAKLAALLASTEDDTLEEPGPGEPGYMGRGQRVFGPYKTYDEGKIAAITLPYECDYWVVEVEAL